MVADNGATAEAVRCPAGVDSGARAMTGSLVALVFGTALAVVALIAAALFANRVQLCAPPGAWARLRRCLTANVAATAEDAPLPELRPRCFAAPPGVLYAAARDAARACGWVIVADESQALTFEAVVTTPLWRFRDDVRVCAVAAGAGSTLELRASSRVGRGDLGANLRHVRDLYQALRGFGLDASPC